VEIDPAAIHYSEIKLISPFHHTPRFFVKRWSHPPWRHFGARFRHRGNPAGGLPQAFARMKSRSGEIKLAVRP